jgi:hypothetical protein
MSSIINKVVITDEAVFDYESEYGLPIPKAEIKAECERYIDEMNKNGRLLWGYYLRLKFYDQTTDKMLLLFFYKGKTLGLMQMWELCGVCEEGDWTELLEESGQIRLWLKSKLSTEELTDWVWDLRVKADKQRKELEDYNDCYGN